MAKLVGKEAKSDGKIVNKGIIYPGEIKRQENNLPGEMVKFIITEIEENDPPTMGNDLEKPDLLSKKKTMTSRPSRIAPESSGISAALPSIIQFCSICNETLKSREALLEHMQTHPERAQGPLLSCWMCSRGFFHNATEAFMQHLQQQHSTEYQPGNGFICTHCLWKFPIIELYRTHLHTHFPAKMYTRIPPAYQEVKVMESKNKGGSQEKKGVLCINCLRNFKTKFDYRKHLRDHTNCFYCQKMCSTRQELLNHVESCHRGLPVDLSNSPVMCTICRTHHSDLPKLKKHLEEEHRKEVVHKRIFCRGGITIAVSSTKMRKIQSGSEEVKKAKGFNWQSVPIKIIKAEETKIPEAQNEKKTIPGMKNKSEDQLESVIEVSDEEEIKTEWN